MPIPAVEDLSEYCLAFAEIVAKTSWLPSPRTVSRIDAPIFPTCRSRKDCPRFSPIKKDGAVVGMYDDNTTPEWAIFWTHGLEGTRSKGWTIAHVWPASDDMGSYTHLANLVMVPEPLASLTDKDGPLVAFLRWHAWQVYGWKPERHERPKEPEGYAAIGWRYLDAVDYPEASIRRRLDELDNQRTRILRPIMANLKMP